MNNLGIIIIGVVSGILTSALLFLVIQVFNKIILPWYQGAIYRGVDIQGEWTEEQDFDSGTKQCTTFCLTQKANAISGSVIVVKSTHGQVRKTDIMNLRGTLNDRLLNVTIIPADLKRLGIGTFLLEVIGDASTMEGHSCWYDSGNGFIASKESVWMRK